jgi:hypothetical protein
MSRELNPHPLTLEHVCRLQDALAVVDLRTGTSGRGFFELVVVKRDHVKVILRRELNHATPHFHIEYKCEHSASYSIDPLQRLAGHMPAKYESKVLEWCCNHKEEMLSTWKALHAGKDVRELIISSPGDTL